MKKIIFGFLLFFSFQTQVFCKKKCKESMKGYIHTTVSENYRAANKDSFVLRDSSNNLFRFNRTFYKEWDFSSKGKGDRDISGQCIGSNYYNAELDIHIVINLISTVATYDCPKEAHYGATIIVVGRSNGSLSVSKKTKRGLLNVNYRYPKKNKFIVKSRIYPEYRFMDESLYDVYFSENDGIILYYSLKEGFVGYNNTNDNIKLTIVR